MSNLVKAVHANEIKVLEKMIEDAKRDVSYFVTKVEEERLKLNSLTINLRLKREQYDKL